MDSLGHFPPLSYPQYLMALFERLGAFKSWAKETGTARAVLARDKRLEEPLSAAITANHFALKDVSSTPS